MVAPTIATLIYKTDTFEAVRDQIAVLLANNVARQKELAEVAGEDPRLWDMLVYTERSAPWETYLNDPPEVPAAPIVNVWYESGSFDRSKGDAVKRQAHAGQFNVDVYGFASASTDREDPSRQLPADRQAAFAAQRGIRLCRNILMAGDNTYLQLRGTVWSRWVSSIQSFQPELSEDAALRAIGIRLTLAVEFNEFSPQTDGVILDEVSVDIHRDIDGKVIAQAEFEGLETPPGAFVGSKVSLEFDSADLIIGLETAADDTAFDFGIPGIGGAFSIMAWVKPMSSALSATIFALGDVADGRNRFLIQQNTSGTGAVSIDIESVSPLRIKRYNTTTGSPPIFTDDRWFQILVTFDGNNDVDSLQVYLDSVLATTNKPTNQDISAIFNTSMEGSIGGYKSAGALPGKHRIYSIATWDVELSASHAIAIHNGFDPSNFDLRANSGDYDVASSVKSWWEVAKTLSPNLGTDRGPQGVNMNTQVNVGDPDVVADFPQP